MTVRCKVYIFIAILVMEWTNSIEIIIEIVDKIKQKWQSGMEIREVDDIHFKLQNFQLIVHPYMPTSRPQNHG